MVPLIFFADVVQADHKTDAKAAFDAANAAWNALDVDAAQKHYLPDCKIFWPNGNIVERPNFGGPRNFIGSGGKWQTSFVYEDINVYGETAVITGVSQ